MKVYVFGNEDQNFDNNALKITEQLKNEFTQIDFVLVKPNEDLPFVGEQNVILMDTVADIEEPIYLNKPDLRALILSPRLTAHDFDLNFQLRYLQKLGKIGTVSIIALPMFSPINYSSIQSIFKKLVAQDIQGS